MRDAVRKRAAILRVTPLQRPRNAYKLNFEMLGLCSDNRISVSADIDKRKVGRELRIALRQRLFQIARPSRMSIRRETTAH